MTCKIRNLYIAACIWLLPQVATATTYTLASSGAYSSAGTWVNGVVPPVSLGADTLIISPNSGSYILTLDKDIRLSGNTYINMGHTLINESGKRFIDMQGGLITSTLSRIDVDSFTIAGSSVLDFNGTIEVRKLTLDRVNYNPGSNSNTRITKGVHIINGVSKISSSNAIHLAHNSMLKVFCIISFTNGGGLEATPAMATLLGKLAYGVYYGNPNTATGPDAYNEHTATVPLIEVDTKGTDILLKANLDYQCILVLTSGELDMNGYNLNAVLRNSNDSYVIAASPNAKLILAPETGTVGKIRFRPSRNTLRSFLALTHIIITGDLQTDTLDCNAFLVIKKGILQVTAHVVVPPATNQPVNTWVYTDTGGRLRMNVNNGKVSARLGSNAHYMPITVSNIKDSATCDLIVTSGIRYGNTTGPYMSPKEVVINGTWTILNQFTGIDIELGWDTAGTHFSLDKQDCILSRFDDTAWEKHLPPIAYPTGARLVSVKRTNVDAGSFAIMNRSVFYSVPVTTQTLKTMHVFPNPASGTVHISFDAGSSGAATLYITNVLGNIVVEKPIQQTTGKNTLAIDVNTLAAGIYHITIPGTHTYKGTLAVQ